MEPLPVILVLAVAAGFSSGASQFLNLDIDSVKRMVLEYEPVLKEQLAHNEAVPLAVRQFHESILQAERLAADPIPKVAQDLGLTDLVSSVVKAGLAPTLESAGPFTVFGPTNDAFFKLPEWVKKEVANVTVLAEVLKFHVLSGKVESKSLKNELEVATVEGSKLRINLYTKDSKTVATAQCA
ncbi:hypothetical protein EGW08_006641, partial [Elysia chlorotica]